MPEEEELGSGSESVGLSGIRQEAAKVMQALQATERGFVEGLGERGVETPEGAKRSTQAEARLGCATTFVNARGNAGPAEVKVSVYRRIVVKTG